MPNSLEIELIAIILKLAQQQTEKLIDLLDDIKAGAYRNVERC